MAAQPGRDVFRTQLVLAEQRELYDYWQACSESDGHVRRKSIRPEHIPRLLPNISLVEVAYRPTMFRCRLAGTRLREVYDRDITGLRLDEIHTGDLLSYWRRVFSRNVETGLPSQGALKGFSSEKEHLVQFWLRLPLVLEKANVAMILCHDSCLPTAESSDLLNLRQEFKDIAAAV
jgi:hypothetical protein